jgi:SAM-dependent methyltransferase
MRQVEVIDSHKKFSLLSGIVKNQGAPDVPIEILEAGCGQRWLLQLGEKKFRLVGIDLDKDAMEIRRAIRGDLDEAIHADLRTVSLGDRKFDVIYSAFVLEHIVGAEQVLERMVDWLKPGGIIVIEIPDPATVKGWVTKVTPHWFHIFYYRFVLNKSTAGLPGYGPYRTIYDPVVSRGGIYQFCSRLGLSVEHEYAFRTDGPSNSVKRLVIDVITASVRMLSFGVLVNDHADLLIVLRKPI